MEIRYHVTGEKRKELVKIIAAVTGAKSKYIGMPSAAYEIDRFMVTKDGSMVFDDAADSEEVETLMKAIAEAGFKCEEKVQSMPSTLKCRGITTRMRRLKI